MNGKLITYIGPNGVMYNCKTVKELIKRVGGTRADKIYMDRKGFRYHVGYLVNKQFYKMFQALEIQA